MGDANTGGLQGVQNELLTATPQQAPPPGAPPLPLPTTGPVTVTGPPPDYKGLGAGQAQADFAAASANGGWEFDAKSMDAVITNLEDSLDGDCTNARRIGNFVANITPPGAEVASEGYVRTAKESTAAYNAFLTGAVNYLTAYVDTLKKIRTAYVNRDQAAIDALRGIRKTD